MSTTSTYDAAVELNHAKEEDVREAYTYAVPNCDEIGPVREALFVFCMCCGQLFTQAAVSQALACIREVAETFGVEDLPGEQAWFTAAFSLTVGTFILVAGKLGDMFGYKLTYVVGVLWFALWSLICGFSAFARSLVFFDVCRALQGLGLALLFPNAMAVLGHFYPPGSMKKNLVMCLYGAAAPSGFTVGALMSGLFAVRVWWPWTFWACGIISVLLAAMSYILIPHKIGKPSREEPFDWLGSGLGMSGLILFNFCWNQGPSVGWGTVYIYVLLIVSVILMVLFAIVELHTEYPIVPIMSLKGEPWFVLGCISAGWSCFGIWLFYTFQWGFTVDRINPVISGVQVIPCAFAGFVAAITTAFLLQKMSLSKVMIMAMVAFFAGITVMGTRHVGQTYWGQKFVSFIITPFGMDMSFPAATIILSNHFAPSQQGIAASLVATFVNYSISLGLGFAGTVEAYKTRNLPKTFDLQVWGYRVAFYMGMGLAGLGVLFSIVGAIMQHRDQKRAKKMEAGQESTTEKSQ